MCINGTCCQEFVSFLEGCPLERVSFKRETTVSYWLRNSNPSCHSDVIICNISVPQGCENSIDSMVQEGAGHILDSVFALARQCGELVLATETRLTCLRDDVEGQTGRKVSGDIQTD